MFHKNQNVNLKSYTNKEGLGIGLILWYDPSNGKGI
jgi:hypothetical protein